MKILVSGSRYWNDKQRIEKAFDALEIIDNEIPTVIHGDCQGLDRLAGKVAKERGWEVISVPADWGTFGKSAGPIRNRKMLDLNPDIVIWFHDSIEESKGTKNLIDQATEQAKKKKIKIICGN